MAIGRNDPCHCGSGKKYKKCCLPRDEAQRVREAPRDPHFITELRPDVNEDVDRALQRLERGEVEQAEREIVQLLESFPDYHMTNYAMGVYYASVAKDAPSAIPFFEKAVALFPPFPEAHFNLGMASRQVFDVVTSIEALRNAERYSHGDEIARMAQKELLWFEQTLLKDGTFKSLDAYIANGKLFDRAFECLRDRKFRDAVELFKQVLNENPKHVQSYGNLALAFAGLGRRGEALACLDRALGLNPQYQPALFNRPVIVEMREGEPFIPDAIQQVEFYADEVRRKADG